MNNIKNYTEYLLEMKSEKDIVKDLARRLSLDKDIIKYLNTSRAKRPMGWREMLATKLHGKNLDYINYLTKNMVADYNPQITGYININNEDGDFDKNQEELNLNDRDSMPIKDRIEDIENRVEDIEDVLGIDPEDETTVDRAREELGLNIDDEDIEEEEE